jgi:hypothetical protein
VADSPTLERYSYTLVWRGALLLVDQQQDKACHKTEHPADKPSNRLKPPKDP